MKKKDLVLLAGGAAAVALLGFLLLLLGGPDPKAAPRRLETQVPYPLLLIHGLGGNGQEWSDSGFTGYLQQQGLRFGGEVGLSKEGKFFHHAGEFPAASADFFVFSASDPFESLGPWARELEISIERILEWTDAPKVALVGFSAGGVAARKYLVEHPEDHRVAKLVTIASPHQGSPLALLYWLNQRVEEALAGDGPVAAATRRAYEAVVHKVEEAFHQKIDAPLLGELIPPDFGGTYLEELNRRPHPTDLEYACVITTGSPMELHLQALQAELAKLRSRDLRGSTFVRKVTTIMMNFLGALGGEPPEPGDSAVLDGSQNLRKIPFFQGNPQLRVHVARVSSNHSLAQQKYLAIIRAIAEPAKVVRARLEKNRSLVVDFADYLPPLGQITARDGGGRRTGVSEPEIWREGDQAVARRRIRTLPEVPSGCLDLLITSPGRQETFGSRLALSPADAAGGAPCPLPSLDGPITFHLERILGISHLVPDLFDSQPEVLAVLFIDDREAARSPETRHPPDPFAIDWRTDLGFDPHAQRLRLELWDMDPGSIPQTLATARWNPGELKVGRTTMTLERGLGIELDVLPEGGDPVVWRPEVLSLESIR